MVQPRADVRTKRVIVSCVLVLPTSTTVVFVCSFVFGQLSTKRSKHFFSHFDERRTRDRKTTKGGRTKEKKSHAYSQSTPESEEGDETTNTGSVDPRHSPQEGGPRLAPRQRAEAKTPNFRAQNRRTNQRDPVDNPTGQGKQPAGKHLPAARKTCRLSQVSDGNKYFGHLSLQEDGVRTLRVGGRRRALLLCACRSPCFLSVAFGTGSSSLL